MIDFDAQIKAEAASDKSSAEMMTEIIGDLHRCNYGIAEHHVAILTARLEYEEQERREAKARPAETKPDAFEQRIQGFIANLEKQTPDMPYYNHFVGERCAYRYALEIYEETRS